MPGSLLKARYDQTQPLAHGMPEHGDVFFDNSPVFRLEPDAAHEGCRARRVVRLGDARSTVAGPGVRPTCRTAWTVVEAKVGKGKLFLYGPEITFRGQPHGTFKLLFNGIYYGPAESTTVR